ncbi:MAG: antitoxin Xre/MbcA/ParS toxin-binding domain-containing protein [Thermoleophilia bacterium]|jgi:putative toxin-antitoxin system antitoxin component (TIGR02293 family)
MQYSQVADILGGRKVLGRNLRTRMDFVELGGAGITRDAASHLASYLSLSLAGVARLLPVTSRTLQRYSAKKRLSPAVSEQVLQLAEVVATGAEVFGERENFLVWLSLPSAPLGERKPIDLLSSRFGAEMVLDELGRIAHGIPA